MKVHRTATIYSVIFAVLFMSAHCEAQCTGADQFVVCPSLDRIFIIQDWFESQPHYLAALSLSGGEVKWRIDLSQTTVHSNPAATADVVAFSTGETPEQIEAFDARTGKPVWKIRRRTYGITSVGPIIFADSLRPGGLIAIDGKTGAVLWSPAGKRGDFARFYESSGQMLLTNLYALDAYSGRISKHWPRAWTVSAAAFGEKFVVIGNRYAGPKIGTLAVYSLPNYELAWVKDDSLRGEIAGVAADADHIFAAVYPQRWESFQAGEVRLEMVSAPSGKTIWTKMMNSAELFPSAVGLAQAVGVFATGESPDSGIVQGFDATTGAVKWTVRTDKKISEVVCPNDTCYIDSPMGEVLAIDVHRGTQRWYRIPTQ